MSRDSAWVQEELGDVVPGKKLPRNTLKRKGHMCEKFGRVGERVVTGSERR